MTSRVRVSARSRPSPPLYSHFNRPSMLLTLCQVLFGGRQWQITISLSIYLSDSTSIYLSIYLYPLSLFLSVCLFSLHALSLYCSEFVLFALSLSLSLSLTPSIFSPPPLSLCAFFQHLCFFFLHVTFLSICARFYELSLSLSLSLCVWTFSVCLSLSLCELSLSFSP